MNTHAKLSPSGAHRWMACPGSVVLEEGKPDGSNAYSDEGTAAHAVAAMALVECRPASAYIGRRIDVGPGRTVEVTRDMADGVQVYVDNIIDRMANYKLAGASVDMLVETAVPIGHITGEDGASGTADAILIATWPDGRCVLDLNDLKFGRGVEVSAEKNAQLMLYALGALEVVAPLGIEPHRAYLVIHQPRINTAPSEWDCSIEALRDFGAEAEGAAVGCRAAEFEQATAVPEEWRAAHLQPGEKQCRFCRAKATCPALARFVEEVVGREFETINDMVPPAIGRYEVDDLARKMAACNLIEDWIKAVRAEVERRLLAGDKVPGYKLVQGRAGARAWSDAEAAEKMLRETFRLPVEKAYNLSLISPTTAEKLAKAGDIGPKQWPKLQPLIGRSEGKPSVAPESDKRPALEVKPVVDEFTEVAP